MAVLFKINNLCGFTLQKAIAALSSRSFSNGVLGIKKFSTDVSPIPEDIEETELISKKKLEKIEEKRNVSRLNPQDINRVHGKMAYPEPKADFHITVKYRRKMYGLHGSESGVNPGVMWPTKEDIKERKEYESIAYPHTIQEMVSAELSKREAEEAWILKRQTQVTENMKKLNQWMKDLNAKRAKKINEIKAAKEKKDRLIEEVRRHFGYTVDHRDERFQQMLEQKEKEEKKTAKLERKKKRDDMMMQDLLAHAQKEIK